MKTSYWTADLALRVYYETENSKAGPNYHIIMKEKPLTTRHETPLLAIKVADYCFSRWFLPKIYIQISTSKIRVRSYFTWGSMTVNGDGQYPILLTSRLYQIYCPIAHKHCTR